MNCLFSPCKSTSKFQKIGVEGLKTIIQRSKEKGDGLHMYNEAKLATESPLQLRCHGSCRATYTSKDHRARESSKKRKAEADESDPPVRHLRS